LAFSYWIDNLGFVTEGKLTAIFIKPSLGVSNWPVIYIINYMPTSFLAPFNMAPSATYQRMMQNFLGSQIGRNIQVYIDDVVITTRKEASLISDL
jgi:hypothetical protein